MQQSNHSVEPVSHSHLHVNRRWSKHRPMTSLQEWAVCWGGEQAYADASFQQWQGKDKKWAVKKVQLLSSRTRILSWKVLSMSYLTALLCFFLELCRESTGTGLSKRGEVGMGWCFAWWIFGWDNLKSVKAYQLVKEDDQARWRWLQ